METSSTQPPIGSSVLNPAGGISHKNKSKHKNKPKTNSKTTVNTAHPKGSKGRLQYSKEELIALSQSPLSNMKPLSLPKELDRTLSKKTSKDISGSSHRETEQHRGKPPHSANRSHGKKWNTWKEQSSQSHHHKNEVDDAEPEWADADVDFTESFDFAGRVLDRDKDVLQHSVEYGHSEHAHDPSREQSRFGFAFDEPDIPSRDSSRFAFVQPQPSSAPRSKFGFALETSHDVQGSLQQDFSHLSMSGTSSRQYPVPSAPPSQAHMSVDGLFQMYQGSHSSKLPPMPTQTHVHGNLPPMPSSGAMSIEELERKVRR